MFCSTRRAGPDSSVARHLQRGVLSARCVDGFQQLCYVLLFPLSLAPSPQTSVRLDSADHSFPNACIHTGSGLAPLHSKRYSVGQRRRTTWTGKKAKRAPALSGILHSTSPAAEICLAEIRSLWSWRAMLLRQDSLGEMPSLPRTMWSPWFASPSSPIRSRIYLSRFGCRQLQRRACHWLNLVGRKQTLGRTGLFPKRSGCIVTTW